MQFKSIWRLLYIDHPKEEVKASVVKFAVQWIRISNNSWLFGLIIWIQGQISPLFFNFLRLLIFTDVLYIWLFIWLLIQCLLAWLLHLHRGFGPVRICWCLYGLTSRECEQFVIILFLRSSGLGFSHKCRFGLTLKFLPIKVIVFRIRYLINLGPIALTFITI